MNELVLDCSVTMAWRFKDESNVIAEKALRVVGSGGKAWVPAIWIFEVANALIVGERKNRIAPHQSKYFTRYLRSIPIHVAPDDKGTFDVLNELTDLGRDANLTAYDAAYLRLSLQKKLPLATLDAKLASAAHTVGVDVF